MVADRMSSVPESGTVKISNLVSRMKAEGVDVLAFSMGEPDFGTPENIVQVAKDTLDERFTHYTPSKGIPELRRAVADKSDRDNGIRCGSSNVLITPSKQAIFLSCLAFLQEGDEVIMQDPTWGTYEACVRLTGARPRFVPVSAASEYRMTPEMVAEQINENTKMIVMNTPSNPCGSVLSSDEIRGIADLAKDHDLMVMADEVYEKIIYEGNHLSIASLDGMMERTLTINGFSKTYAMTGWRLGWLLASEENINVVNKLQTQSITCCVSFTQTAGVEALNGPQESVATMVKEFGERRKLVLDLMDEIPSINVLPPKGAFYVFPEYDFDMSSERLATYLLEKARVAITPGAAFGTSGEGHFRLSYAASRESLEEGLGRMKRALAQL